MKKITVIALLLVVLCLASCGTAPATTTTEAATTTTEAAVTTTTEAAATTTTTATEAPTTQSGPPVKRYTLDPDDTVYSLDLSMLYNAETDEFVLPGLTRGSDYDDFVAAFGGDSVSYPPMENDDFNPGLWFVFTAGDKEYRALPGTAVSKDSSGNYVLQTLSLVLVPDVETITKEDADLILAELTEIFGEPDTTDTTDLSESKRRYETYISEGSQWKNEAGDSIMWLVCDYGDDELVEIDILTGFTGGM